MFTFNMLYSQQQLRSLRSNILCHLTVPNISTPAEASVWQEKCSLRSPYIVGFGQSETDDGDQEEVSGAESHEMVL